MSVPISQMWAVARHVLSHRVRRQERYPLVLMLEPLFRCNLACAGCGKIQHPKDVLKSNVSVEDCLAAAEECGAPIVSIPGGEPLLHPEIDRIVEGLIAQKRYIYLCTNAILLMKHLDRFRPDKHLSFSVHLDGPRDEHDAAVCRDGIYDVAIEAIEESLARGFRVTTNTTVFTNATPEATAGFFDTLTEIGVEGMMVSPGFAYEKAPDQSNFCATDHTHRFFSELLELGRQRRGSKAWKFNQSPLFLEFLRGEVSLECTPWGSPTYNLFGWQKPCYLFDEGYAESFDELMSATEWSNYGRASGHANCQDCMVHCGYEPSAVALTFGSLGGLAATAQRTLFGLPKRDRVDKRPIDTPVTTARKTGELVQLDVGGEHAA